MNLKKTLATVALLGAFAGNSFGFKIGEEMPKLDNRPKLTETNKDSKTKNSYYPYLDTFGKIISERGFEYIAVFSSSKRCKKINDQFEYFPIAIYSYENDEVYLDRGMTGKIEYIIKKPTNSMTLKETVPHIVPYFC
jgi:hypothetical protein